MFFQGCSLLSVVFSGFFLGFFCYVILSLSSRFGSVFHSFGFLKLPIQIIVLLANFCVLCATISGSESLLSEAFSLRGGGILTAFFCLLVLLAGIRYVRYLNFFVVPVLIVLVAIVFFKGNLFSLPVGKVSVVKPFHYAAMNIVTGGFFIGTSGDAPTKKESVFCSLISGLTLTVMLVLIRLSVQNVSAEMPFLARADELNLLTLGYAILYLAMITTVIGTLSVCSGGKKIPAVLIACGALLVSSFGFQSIVDAAYPVLGAVGGAVAICALVIFLLTLNPRSSRYYTLLFRPDGSLFRRRSPRGN